jgi:hypothetical protein
MSIRICMDKDILDIDYGVTRFLANHYQKELRKIERNEPIKYPTYLKTRSLIKRSSLFSWKIESNLIQELRSMGIKRYGEKYNWRYILLDNEDANLFRLSSKLEYNMYDLDAELYDNLQKHGLIKND